PPRPDRRRPAPRRRAAGVQAVLGGRQRLVEQGSGELTSAPSGPRNLGGGQRRPERTAGATVSPWRAQFSANLVGALAPSSPARFCSPPRRRAGTLLAHLESARENSHVRPPPAPRRRLLREPRLRRRRGIVPPVLLRQLALAHDRPLPRRPHRRRRRRA